MNSPATKLQPTTNTQQVRLSSADLPRAGLPPVGFGLASVALGTIGWLLFILPVLSIPIAALGLLLGIIGCLAALLARQASLRLSLAGVIVSALAVGTVTAITLAPAGYLPNSAVQQVIEPVPGRPYVPPPASVEP